MKVCSAKICIICAALIGFSACADNRVSTLETATKSANKDLQEIRSLIAEHGAAIAEIRAEQRELRGHIEEMQHVSTGKTEQLERTIEQFGSRVPPPEGVPVDLLNRDEELIARNSGLPAETYRRALRMLRMGDFQGSAGAFHDFAEKNPDTSFSDNALFFLGICHEKLGQYDKAILAYNDVLQKYPAEDMVPAALFRLGEAFIKVGSEKDALLTFDKLVDEFPRTEFAAQAAKRRAELKKVSGRKR